MITSIYYDDLTWRSSGYFNDIGDDIRLYHHDTDSPGDVEYKEPDYHKISILSYAI